MFSNLLKKEPPKNLKNEAFSWAQDDEDQNDTDVLKPKYRTINLRKFAKKSDRLEKHFEKEEFFDTFSHDMMEDILPSTKKFISSVKNHKSKVWDFKFFII